MQKTEISTPYSRFWIENDVLYGEYFHNVIMNIEVAKISLDARLKLCENKDYLFLLNMSQLKSVTKEAREYLATKEATRGITAGAFIIDSTVSKTIGNFYLAINKPSTPAKLFTDKEDALNWLQQFK